MASNPWAVSIGSGLVISLIARLLWIAPKRLFGRRKRADSGVGVQQTASPVVTQNFQPEINIRFVAPTAQDAASQEIEERPQEITQSDLVTEDGICWRQRADGTRVGPYCPRCEANAKPMPLSPGLTSGTYICHECDASFLTSEYRRRSRPRRPPENRPYVATSKPANGTEPEQEYL